MVGVINKDEIVDKETTFKPCSSSISEYYNYDIGYKTERYGIRKIIEIPIKKLKFPNISGLINVRFVINCKNEIGYFKITTTNQAYQNIEINEHLKLEIVKIIQQLNDWNSKNEDAYYQIYIKLRNGKVEDIF